MATANIWYNLSAWTNHTFTLGERCGTGGNAYQCITAGTSTVAPTGTSADVDNGGTAHFKWLSAINYTSFNGWFNTLPSTQTQDWVVQYWNTGTVNLGASDSIINYYGIDANGHTTLFCCAPGESIRDHPISPLSFNAANGVSFTAPSSGIVTPSSGTWINIGVDNTTVDGIQVIDPNTSSDTHCVQIGAANCVVRGVLFDSSMIATDTVQLCYMAGPNAGLINSLLIQRSHTAFGHTVKWELGVSATGGYVSGCTIISTTNTTDSDAVCGLENAGQVTVSDCAIFGYSNPINSQNTAGCVVVDHSCFSAADLTNSLGSGNTDNGGNLFSKTAANQFVNSSTDFRIKSSADCVGAGATDTAYIPLGDDFFRIARTVPWDIGASSLADAVQSGSASISGAGTVGSLRGTLLEIARPNAIAGAGTTTVKGAMTDAASVSIAGAGSIATVQTVATDATSLSIAGAGTAITQTIMTDVARLSIFGNGLVLSSGIAQMVARATIAGAGTLTLNERAILSSEPLGIGGSGFVTVDTIYQPGVQPTNWPGKSDIAGAGTVSIQEAETEVSVVGVFGTGSVSASSRATLAGRSAISGTGSIPVSDSIVTLAASSAITGTGQISINETYIPAGLYDASSDVVGGGSISVMGQQIQAANLSIFGFGSVSVTLGRSQVIRDTLAIAGSGQVVVTGSQAQRAVPTAIAGRGTVNVDASVHTAHQFTGPIIINGTGSVSIIGDAQSSFTSVAIAGQGSVFASGDTFNYFTEVNIEGRGHVSVNAYHLRYIPPFVPAPPPTQLDIYDSLIPAYNAVQPNFMATLNALLKPMVALQSFIQSLPSAFDLDVAIGTQLDQVGIWIGRSRFIKAPIVGVFFSWDVVGLGWEEGTWQGTFDPSEGLQVLDDGTYRQLLYAKVAANNWDGTSNGVVTAIESLFAGLDVIVKVIDNQDMTMTVNVSGIVGSVLFQSLLLGGYVPIKPEGVQLTYNLEGIPGVGRNWDAAVRIAGAGTVAVTGTQRMQSVVAVPGQGTVVHTWVVGNNFILSNEPHVIGAGSVGVSGKLTETTSATIQGAGAVHVHAEIGTTYSARADIAGHGNVHVTVPATQLRIVNWLRNPRGVGALAGTPGTDPATWFLADSGTGLSKTINGFGTQNGIPYIEIRVFGTPVSDGYYTFQLSEIYNGIADLSDGLPYSVSSYLSIPAGDMTGLGQVQIGFEFYGGGSGFDFLGSDSSTNLFVPVGAALSFFSYDNIILGAFGTVNDLVPTISLEVNNTANVDITLRIAAPKVEQATSSSSLIILPAPGTFPDLGYGTSIVF